MALIDSLTAAINKFTNQSHLHALRSGLGITAPIYFAASFVILFTHVVAPLIFNGGILNKIQLVGGLISENIFGFMGLLVAASVAYMLAKLKNYDNPIAPSMMSVTILLLLVSIDKVIQASDVIVSESFSEKSLFGTVSMLSGIVVGLLATEIFLFIAKKEIVIPLGKNVPPLVSRSFTGLFPAIFTVFVFGLLAIFFDTSLISFINEYLQQPLQALSTSIYGYTLIYGVGNVLFSFGIHHTGLTGIVLDPFLLLNMNENIQALASGQVIPHIITNSFQVAYTQIGGSGGTISLLLAIFLFSKEQSSRGVAKVATMPGVFAINEPVIFGFPVVFNLPMIIPFVLVPAISSILAYYATYFEYVNKTVVMIPWTTPPFISGYLSTAGDWRAVILQAILILIGAAIYLPFMKLSERAARSAQS